MSLIIMVILSAIAGTIMWFVSIESLVGYSIGIVLGIMLIVLSLRRLGRKARWSSLASNIFHKITHYKATVYRIQGQQAKSVSATVYNDGHDYADLVDILKNQLHFQADTAKEAAKYAIGIAQDKPIEEKLKEALKYLDGGNHNENVATGA